MDFIALNKEMHALDLKVQIANRNTVPFRIQIALRFFVTGKHFAETFMILQTMGNILVGLSFFQTRLSNAGHP